MDKNVGQKDRIARAVIGLLAVLAGVILPVGIIMSIVLIALGIVLILSALFNFFFLYKACGKRSNAPPTKPENPL